MIKKQQINDILLNLLDLKPGEMDFNDLWNHFIKRGDFENLAVLDTKAMYNSKGEHLKPMPIGIVDSDLFHDLFYSNDEIPSVFKKKMGTQICISDYAKFYDYGKTGQIVIYGKRRKKDGDWSKVNFQLVVYNII